MARDNGKRNPRRLCRGSIAEERGRLYPPAPQSRIIAERGLTEKPTLSASNAIRGHLPFLEAGNAHSRPAFFPQHNGPDAAAGPRRAGIWPRRVVELFSSPDDVRVIYYDRRASDQTG